MGGGGGVDGFDSLSCTPALSVQLFLNFFGGWGGVGEGGLVNHDVAERTQIPTVCMSKARNLFDKRVYSWLWRDGQKVSVVSPSDFARTLAGILH